MPVDISRLRGRLIDLHLHIDGSVSVSSARRLAALAGQADGLSEAELFAQLSVGDDCKDLNGYLAKFDYPLSLLQTSAQITACVGALQEELLALGYLYAELRFAPQSHCRRGLSQRAVIEAAISGLHQSGFEARLILCCMRGTPLEVNLKTVELASEYLGDEVVAVDLAGAEGLFPTRDHAEVLSRACALGVPITVHAGEAAGPQSVRDALDLGARRIGHGIRAAEDPQLVRELAASGVPLEICPTSEVQTGALGGYRSSSLCQLLDAGVCLTLNTDNMVVSNTWLGREFAILSEAMGLTDDDATTLLANSVDAAFVDEDTRSRLRAAVLG